MFKAHTIMFTDPISVQADTSMIEAIRLFVKHHLSSLPVVDTENNLIGIVSEKDALSLLQSQSDQVLHVSDFMTRDVVHFDVNGSVLEISKCLAKSSFREIPITSGGKRLVGIVNRTHIMKRILEMKHVSVEQSDLDGEDA